MLAEPEENHLITRRFIAVFKVTRSWVLARRISDHIDACSRTFSFRIHSTNIDLIGCARREGIDRCIAFTDTFVFNII